MFGPILHISSPKLAAYCTINGMQQIVKESRRRLK